MDLLLDDVADLLKVSRQEVEEWVEKREIPHYQLGEEIRFDPEQIENWMLTRGATPYSGSNVEKATAGTNHFMLYRALHRGDVLQGVPGDTREEVIKNTLNRLAEDLDFDAEGVTSLFLERERMMPTALGNGIAVPHTREFKLNPHFDAVVVVFPEKPLEYEALDGELVHTLCFLFASDDRRHLNLLAKLAHLASQPDVKDILSGNPSKPELMDKVRAWEASL